MDDPTPCTLGHPRVRFSNGRPWCPPCTARRRDARKAGVTIDSTLSPEEHERQRQERGRRVAEASARRVAQRQADIAAEAEHLLGLKVWPEEIADRLGYAAAGNLSTVLKRWGYPDLAKRFDRVNFDGLALPGHITQYARRNGAAA